MQHASRLWSGTTLLTVVARGPRYERHGPLKSGILIRGTSSLDKGHIASPRAIHSSKPSRSLGLQLIAVYLLDSTTAPDMRFQTSAPSTCVGKPTLCADSLPSFPRPYWSGILHGLWVRCACCHRPLITLTLGTESIRGCLSPST